MTITHWPHFSSEKYIRIYITSETVAPLHREELSLVLLTCGSINLTHGLFLSNLFPALCFSMFFFFSLIKVQQDECKGIRKEIHNEHGVKSNPCTLLPTFLIMCHFRRQRFLWYSFYLRSLFHFSFAWDRLTVSQPSSLWTLWQYI